MRKHNRKDFNETLRHRLDQMRRCEEWLSARGVKVQRAVVGVAHARPRLVVDPVTARGRLRGVVTRSGMHDRVPWVVYAAPVRGCQVEWKTEVRV